MRGRLDTASKAPEAQEDAEDMGMAILSSVAEAGAKGIMGKRAMRGLVAGSNAAIDRTIGGLVDAGLIAKTRDGKADLFTITVDGLELLQSA